MSSPVHPRFTHLLLAGLVVLLAGCAPTPETNVVGYLLARRLGNLQTPANLPTGAISGTVYSADGEPLPGATALVAERTGAPHSALTDETGRYHITDVPAGQYVPAAVAPGYEEAAAVDSWGRSRLVTVRANATITAPAIHLAPHRPRALPSPLPAAAAPHRTAAYTATAAYPPGAEAQVMAYTYTVPPQPGALAADTHDAVTLDSLRLYLPGHVSPTAAPNAPEPLPLLFMIYPTPADDWEPVSVAFASAGYAFVALSPAGAYGIDIDAHAYSARIAFHLAQEGMLHPAVAPDQAILLGGSFSSPILHRFLRDESPNVAGWITVGGISNAFRIADDFYSGRINLPADRELAIPALGAPNLYPLPFLRYSPVYTAAQMPSTLIVHTAADRVTPIDQAYALERALRTAGVPVQTYYYEDVSHYLQIGENMSEAGAEIFRRVFAFARTLQDTSPRP